MERKIYIDNDILELVEYTSDDDWESYQNWFDPETQMGYNYLLKDTYDEYCKIEHKHRLYASIRIKRTSEIIGTISLSAEGSLPDLAIRIHKEYRKQGYGTKAFSLGIRYCFEKLKIDKIYAGCFPHNKASQKMLKRCGFIPNPSGNVNEKHYLTGEPIIQYDYILLNDNLEV